MTSISHGKPRTRRLALKLTKFRYLSTLTRVLYVVLDVNLDVFFFQAIFRYWEAFGHEIVILNFLAEKSGCSLVDLRSKALRY